MLLLFMSCTILRSRIYSDNNLAEMTVQCNNCGNINIHTITHAITKNDESVSIYYDKLEKRLCNNPYCDDGHYHLYPNTIKKITEWDTNDVDELNTVAAKYGIGEIMGSSRGNGDKLFPFCGTSDCWCNHCSMSHLADYNDDPFNDATFDAIKNFKDYLNDKMKIDLKTRYVIISKTINLR